MNHRFPRCWRLLGCLAVLLTGGAVLPQGCSQGHNSVLNPNTNRTGLQAKAETLSVKLWKPWSPRSADRTIESEINTGLYPVLRLAQTDSVWTIILFRFGALPDTTGITQGQLGLRLNGGDGSNMLVDAYAIDSTSTWSETTVSWSNQPALYSPPFFTSTPISAPAPNDTVYDRGAILIPPRWIQVWARNPGTGGLALRVSHSSPQGTLEIISRDGVITNTAGVIQLNPLLRMVRGTTVDTTQDRQPTLDAYIYNDLRTAWNGTDPLLHVSDWLPTRAIFRIDLRQIDSLGSFPRGVTINRALLHLSVTPAPVDTFQLAVSQALSPWSESGGPDTVTTGTTSGLATISAAALLAVHNRISLDIGSLIQQQLVDSLSKLMIRHDNLDVMVRSVANVKKDHRIDVYSKDYNGADSLSLRPTLEIIYSVPADPRWGVSAGKVTR